MRVGVVVLVLAVACAGDDDGGGTAPEPDAGTRPETCDFSPMPDAACSDGLFCNGLERCAPGSADADARGCVAGLAPCDETCLEAEARCATCEETGDADGDGVVGPACGGPDCDDTNAAVFPGAREVCDAGNVDEDCDPSTTGALDRDGDGQTDARCCNARSDGVLACGQDCNDASPRVAFGRSEVCDGIDNDCNGIIDEGVQVDVFVDADRDGRGDPLSPARACAGAVGFSVFDDDCDDVRRDRHGGLLEACDGVDNDCDGFVDETMATLTWYRDADGDDFGTPSDTVESCAPPAGFALTPLDCDDARRDVSPLATEACNGIDDDCSGRADFTFRREGAGTDLEDDDGDGFPDAACAGDDLRADCDDLDGAIFPGAPELLDGRDNDCNGEVDERCDMALWYLDADGDGYGDDTMAPLATCELVPGRTTRLGDCNDGDAEVNPAGTETCNGVDDDCDGRVDDFGDRSCDVPGALGRCAPGPAFGCDVAGCGGGLADCDGDAENGCEAPADEDPLNCGGCGVVCPGAIPGAVPICTGGRCAFACVMGALDCNREAADGCEVDVRTDGRSCGACGVVCGPQPGASVNECADGACVATCDAGFGDCDGVFETGCEVETATDPANCGACGNACVGEDICAAGACQPPPFFDSAPPRSTLGALTVAAGTTTRLASGVYYYTSITVEAGGRLELDAASSDGTLDLRSYGDVVVDGVVDLSGGRGGDADDGSYAAGQGGGVALPSAGSNAADISVAGERNCPLVLASGGFGLNGEDGDLGAAGCGAGGAKGG
ncbi:MAG: MopE-related protein, partial [Myxococcota bacterium]